MTSHSVTTKKTSHLENLSKWFSQAITKTIIQKQFQNRVENNGKM